MKQKFTYLFLIGSLVISVIFNSCKKKEQNNEFSGNEGTFIDKRDNKEYKWVKIGEQIWMAENLKYTGGNIQHLTDNTQWNYNSNYDAWSYYNNDSNIGGDYAVLYQWEAAKTACPEGWHLPTDDEWNSLINYLGGNMEAGGKMKEENTLHWNAPNTAADNSSGFTGLPGGYRHYNGSFDFLNERGYWWSASESSNSVAHYCVLYYDGSAANIVGFVKPFGLSVRCVKD